ncbi:hypothetical protein JHK85_028730 [Glycine max]|nr:hypothetical protein JHK85_028730 [Glycine max]
MEEGRESKGKLMKKTKRERISRREREKERDRLSELPDCILLYIMKFMNTKYAVQTCILSKRWKNLWKRLIVLTFYPWDFRRVVNFKQFVSKVLSCRNGSISLLNLCILAHSKTISKLLNRIMKYVVLHDDLSNPSTMRTQPLCFVRLESLKVKMNSCLTISDEEVNRLWEGVGTLARARSRPRQSTTAETAVASHPAATAAFSPRLAPGDTSTVRSVKKKLSKRKGTMEKLKLKRTMENGIDKTEDKDRTSDK